MFNSKEFEILDKSAKDYDPQIRFILTILFGIHNYAINLGLDPNTLSIKELAREIITSTNHNLKINSASRIKIKIKSKSKTKTAKAPKRHRLTASNKPTKSHEQGSYRSLCNWIYRQRHARLLHQKGEDPAARGTT